LPASTKKLVLTLAVGYASVLIVLALVHVFLSFSPYYQNNWLAAAFDMDEECNIPSWFASITWFSAAAAAAIAYFIEMKVQLKARGRLLWLAIASVFMAASVDEVLSLHEQTGLMAKHHFETTNSVASQLTDTVPFSPWLIIYLIPILIVLLGILLFINSRTRTLGSRRTALILVIAAVAAYATALNCELYQAMPMNQCQTIASWFKTDVEWLTAVTVVCEEFLETLGTIFFFSAFVAYAHELASSFPRLSVGE